MSVQTVEAKFRCMDNKPANGFDPASNAVEVRLIPVWEENGVNRSWSKATPSGELKMLITNAPAGEFFEIGKSYKLTIEQED